MAYALSDVFNVQMVVNQRCRNSATLIGTNSVMENLTKGGTE